jgi:hypothetical protein
MPEPSDASQGGPTGPDRSCSPSARAPWINPLVRITISFPITIIFWYAFTFGGDESWGTPPFWRAGAAAAYFTWATFWGAVLLHPHYRGRWGIYTLASYLPWSGIVGCLGGGIYRFVKDVVLLARAIGRERSGPVGEETERELAEAQQTAPSADARRLPTEACATFDQAEKASTTDGFCESLDEDDDHTYLCSGCGHEQRDGDTCDLCGGRDWEFVRLDAGGLRRVREARLREPAGGEPRGA